MEGSAHLPHYSQPSRQSAPSLAMHPGQIIDSVSFWEARTTMLPQLNATNSLWSHFCVVVETVAVIKILKMNMQF